MPSAHVASEDRTRAGGERRRRKKRPRRSNEQRTAEMRTRLLDATLECLYRDGYNGTTTPRICKRAGVSRGAQLHHFRTKAELVTAAVEHLFHKRNAEFRTAITRLPEGHRLDATIDLLWEMADTPTYHAWLEIVVAGRTDPEVATHVHAINERLNVSFQETLQELFPEFVSSSPFAHAAMHFVFCTIEGMILGKLAGHPAAMQQGVLTILRALTDQLDDKNRTESNNAERTGVTATTRGTRSRLPKRNDT